MRRPYPSAWLLTVGALLAFVSLSLLCAPRTYAKSALSPAPAASPVTDPAAPPSSEDSGEDTLDDDRAEHWDDPDFSREERVQMAGLTLLLAGVGAGGAWRRRALRKAGHYE